MGNESSSVLLRVAVELLDRGARLKQYLEEIGPGESDEYSQIVETIRTALVKVEELALRTVETLDQTPTLLAPGIPFLYSRLHNLSRWFINIHEVLAYLPRLHATPESISTIQAPFGQHYQALRPSVIL